MTATTDFVRITNGVAELISKGEALAEMNAAQMGETKKQVREMYASGSRASITYRDGRRVEIRPATAADMPVETARPKNLQTHTGVVHAPGRYYRQLRSEAPACCASVSAVLRYHFLIDVDAPVTCKRCLTRLAKQ
jgi:hypothetical protein